MIFTTAEAENRTCDFKKIYLNGSSWNQNLIKLKITSILDVVKCFRSHPGKTSSSCGNNTWQSEGFGVRYYIRFLGCCNNVPPPGQFKTT